MGEPEEEGLEGAKRPFAKVSGTTWEVYLYVLTAREPVGVRDVWRGLGLSSPSLAQYHINKLLAMRLVEQTRDGRYAVGETGRVEALRGFVLLRGRLIPRLVFYGSLISGLLLAYLVLWPFNWDFRDLVVLAIALLSASAFFYEAYRQRRSLRRIVQKV